MGGRSDAHTQFVQQITGIVAQASLASPDDRWRRGSRARLLRNSCQTTMATRISTADATIQRTRGMDARRRVGDLVFTALVNGDAPPPGHGIDVGPPTQIYQGQRCELARRTRVARLACELMEKILQYASARHDVLDLVVQTTVSLRRTVCETGDHQTSGVWNEVWLRRTRQNWLSSCDDVPIPPPHGVRSTLRASLAPSMPRTKSLFCSTDDACLFDRTETMLWRLHVDTHEKQASTDGNHTDTHELRAPIRRARPIIVPARRHQRGPGTIFGASPAAPFRTGSPPAARRRLDLQLQQS